MEEETRKRRKIIISVIIGIIILLILAVAYFGVLNPGKLVGDSRGYTDSSSLYLNVKNGDFEQAEAALRKAVADFDATIYSESIREYNGRQSAYFTIDVPESNVNNILSSLKTIGDVESYTYSKTQNPSSSYNTGLQAGYTRITVSIYEDASVFSSFRNLKGNALGSTFSGSIVALFYFVVAVLPWAAAIAAIYFIIRYIKKKYYS